MKTSSPSSFRVTKYQPNRALHYSSGGPGIAQSHQLGPQRPQSVQTHTPPQTSVPSHVFAQQVKADAASRSDRSFLLASSTCTPNASPFPLSSVSPLPTDRAPAASIVSLPL